MEISAWVILIKKSTEEKWYFLTNGTRTPEILGVSEKPQSAKIYRKKLRAQFMVDQVNETGKYVARLNEVRVNGAITLL